MLAVAFVVFNFAAGSLPFSAWVGRVALDTDIRHVGDGNPGATNVVLAGGFWWGAVAAILDYLKAAIPVFLAAQTLGMGNWGLAPAALAPAFGHAFSPFLRFRGGKALAATLGLWTGLTWGEGPLILGLFFALFVLTLDGDAWAVVLGMLGLGAHLLLNHFTPLLVAVWVGNLLLLLWTHRRELRTPPRLRRWG